MEDHLSVRKTVKNKVNIEGRFYRATQSNVGLVKILPVSPCFCRASLTSGHSGHKGLIQSGHSGSYKPQMEALFRSIFLSLILWIWQHSRLMPFVLIGHIQGQNVPGILWERNINWPGRPESVIHLSDNICKAEACRGTRYARGACLCTYACYFFHVRAACSYIILHSATDAFARCVRQENTQLVSSLSCWVRNYPGTDRNTCNRLE